MDDERARILEGYVKQGGTLIIDGRFGMLDKNARLAEKLPGGALNFLCGAEYRDSDYEGLDFDYAGLSVRGYLGRELVSLTDGEVLGNQRLSQNQQKL